MLTHTAYFTEKPSILTLNKSTVIVWTAISLLVAETFSGALRFYLDKAGISAVLYIPKALCVLLFVLELPRMKAGRTLWLFLIGLALSASLALLHGASLSNIGFSTFAIAPLLFGLTCSNYLLHRKRLFLWVIALLLAASLAGLALDRFTSVPWKGYSYTLGEQELAANTAWSMEDADRLAGFARVSNALSIIIATFSLYMLAFMRNKLLMAVLSGVALVAIWMTTSKAPAAAFFCTIGMMFILRFRWSSRFVFLLAVVGGMALPAIGLLHDFDPTKVTSTSLASLFDRLINTWPNLVRAIQAEGWGLTGSGFGMFGSTLALFPVPGTNTFSGSDSSLMYLWGMLGLAGIVLYFAQVLLFCSLANDVTRLGHALLMISFCSCLIGWTTDMFEVAVANLFIGLAVGHAMSGQLITQRPVYHPPEALKHLPALPNVR